MRWILITLFCFMVASVAKAEDVLKTIYEDIVKNDPTHQFDTITYGLTYKNNLLDDFFISFPGESLWGLPANQYASYEFNKNSDPDFGLPHCVSDLDCAPFGKCAQLAAFNNGNANLRMCIGMADLNLDRLYNVMIKAKHFVDITTLEPFPDLRFKATLRNALLYLAKTGQPITVRILDGLYEPIPTLKKNNVEEQNQASEELSFTTYAYLQDLVHDIKNIPQSRLKIYIAGMRSCAATPRSLCGKNSPSEPMALSWNHSKIIDVDGLYVLTGGVNQWTGNYLEPFPVLDFMVEIQGPAAEKTIGFTNMLWDYVHNNITDYLHVIEYAYDHGEITKSQLPTPIETIIKEGAGSAEILSIGRTGGGILPDGRQENTSDLALYLMLNNALHSIYVAQQSLKNASGEWPYDVIPNALHTHLISAIARLLMKGGEVYIVTSPANGILAGGYSSSSTKQEMWDKIKSETKDIMIMNKTYKTEEDLNKIVCDHLHIANVQFSQDSVWEKDQAIYDHYKFLMIDNRIFYTGSQNFYPSNLQEYGYVIDDEQASMKMLEKFWQPLWSFSKNNALRSKECA